MRKLMIGVSLLGLFTVEAAKAVPASIQSGQYEALMIAVTPEHKVQGYFHEVTGNGVTQTCSLNFEGVIGSGPNVPMSAWSASTKLSGVIRGAENGVVLTIADGDRQPGCGNGMSFDFPTGAEQSLIARKPWIGLVEITTAKALLRSAPDDAASHKAYVVKGDVVAVLKSNSDGWTQVEYISESARSYIGWIHYGEFIIPAPDHSDQ